MKLVNRIGLLIISVIVIYLICVSYYDVTIKKEIKKSKKTLVAKYILKDKSPKITSFYFTYFINGTKHKTANSGINISPENSEFETNAINNLKLNCFYLANFDENHPNIIIINPSKQVTDASLIFKAGFNKNDIKNTIND